MPSNLSLVGIVKIEFCGQPPPFYIDLERSEKVKEAVLSVIANIVERRNGRSI
jgi:hypothetical protein